jgi:hypothetical protein
MYVIRTQKLATYLMERGFELKKTDKNKEDERFNVFLFQDTPILRATVKQYRNMLNKA